MKSNFQFLSSCAIFGSILVYAGCITPKDSVTSRGMQNLTARYNIIYNANLLLEESSGSIEKAHIDNYDQLLTIYKEPSEAISAAEATNLDSIIKKANSIINEKLHSNYVDDAYLLVAKANYLKSNFFNATEYFSYLYNNYPLEKDVRQESLVWKVRALLQLENIAEASNTIDTALKYIETSKKNIADVYASYAQLLITTNKESQAIAVLQKAIDAGTSKHNIIRWKYILAQLQVENKLYEDAYKNFSAVVKSNASFEMAFNANLNRIRIEEEQSGASSDRITRLKSLLKDDKNKDFIDQIYYHIGNIYHEQNLENDAINNYNISVKKSTSNLDQKGITYLKLADIYFNKADYIKAKAYYDSTLSTLSPKYPGYDLIKKKGSNLELLASRYRTIAREDTLQTLAKLPEEQREERIGELVRQQTERALSQVNHQEAVNNLTAGIDVPALSKPTEGKFYFNNSTALSQGLSDFKRKWGNRRLEDNWRRVSKTAAETTISMSADPDATIGASLPASTTALSAETIRDSYLKNLPLTEPLLQQSNQKIAEAYYDIANFYKDELKDEEIAIRTFEELLGRAPESSYNLPVYYNLYRLYQPSNSEKSTAYKNLILSKFPDSPFAKVIQDPNYSREADEKVMALNKAYNEVFNLYTERKYTSVLSAIQQIDQIYGPNKLSPQLAYLNALATGHLQKLPPFENELIQLAANYPSDELITPLVKQHLQFIETNRAQVASRTTALLDYDPTMPFFVEEPVPALVPAAAPAPLTSSAQPQNALVSKTDNSVLPGQQPAKTDGITSPVISQPQPLIEVPETTSTVESPAIKAKDSPFNLPGAAEYYFVINVTDIRYNLSSSRFGVGQFNRSKYSGSSLKHQLQEANNENQLIYVGVFQTFEDVKAYERAIVPLLSDIMKVPAEQYTTFVITKEGLEKLQSRAVINSYTEFYKNSN
ncbi:gliding motility protein [Pedobacter sp. P351]|uniref:type IX secretion system periplasmic lipoprotein PorW/SprE n=1 Tax=Pedobacter superstes TaxID=3133441 RepID=UPI0030B009CD